RIERLMKCTTLQVDDAFNQAYPRQQGAEVELKLSDGTQHRVRLEDVVNASAQEVRTRFRAATANALGPARMEEIDDFIEHLESREEGGQLGKLLRSDPA